MWGYIVWLTRWKGLLRGAGRRGSIYNLRRKTFFCASEKQGFERVRRKTFSCVTQIEPSDRGGLYAAVFQPGQPTEGGNSESGPPDRAVSQPGKQTRKGRDRREVTQAWVLCLRCPGFRGGVPFSFS